mgnify:CR=1 FL=1
MVIVLIVVVLVSMVIGFIWAGKRGYVARRDEFAAEVGKQTLALDEREFLLGRREAALDDRENVLDERNKNRSQQNDSWRKGMRTRMSNLRNGYRVKVVQQGFALP